MKDKIITYLFIIYIVVFSILGIVIKDKELSFTERRKLKTFPEFSFTNEYSKDLEKYLLDHFPFRDNFRGIKASFNYNILNKLDNNGIYLHDNYIFKMEELNKKSINNFINHIEKTSTYLNKDNKVYMLIVPDKNYYLNEKMTIRLDYDYVYQELNKLDNNGIDISIIDIRNIMELSDYYETDTHWRQENILKVVYELDKKMNFNYKEQVFKKNTYNNFYGAYYNESAINRRGDKLVYLENDTINNAYVKYLENKDLHTVYNKVKLNSFDSYEVYLDGSSSFIEIINNNSKTNKELVIYRDSFASSLTPYLINSYKKITLIDNRYISSKNYLNLIDFNNQDILFMYSTLVVNSSFILRN